MSLEQSIIMHSRSVCETTALPDGLADEQRLARLVALLSTGLERLIAAKATPEKIADEQLDFPGDLSVNTPDDVMTTENNL